MDAWLRSLAALLVAGLLSCPGGLLAQDIVVHTQNLLRFGHGSDDDTKYKCAAMAKLSAGVDVILFQELMQPDYPCGDPPAGFKWKKSGPVGTPSYTEYYGFLWRSTPRDGGPTITDPGIEAPATNPKAYARPPYAILLNVSIQKKGKYQLWIATIHSTWGNAGVKPRQAEADAALNFLVALNTGVVKKTAAPVIIGGDWNIPVATKTGNINPGFQRYPKAGYDVLPNVPTTISKKKLKPSSPYDHFAYTAKTLGVKTLTYYDNDIATWRNTVSDHMGVTAYVTFN